MLILDLFYIFFSLQNGIFVALFCVNLQRILLMKSRFYARVMVLLSLSTNGILGPWEEMHESARLCPHLRLRSCLQQILDLIRRY